MSAEYYLCEVLISAASSESGEARLHRYRAVHRCLDWRVQMGEALIRGFITSGVSCANRISASVRNAERQRVLGMMGIQVFGSATDGGAAEIAANSDIIFVGVSLCEEQ